MWNVPLYTLNKLRTPKSRSEETHGWDGGPPLVVVVAEQRNSEVTREQEDGIDDVLISDDDHRRNVVVLHGSTDVANDRLHPTGRRQRHAGCPQRRPLLNRRRRHGLLERGSPVGEVDGGQNGNESRRCGSGGGGGGTGGIDGQRRRSDDDDDDEDTREQLSGTHGRMTSRDCNNSPRHCPEDTCIEPFSVPDVSSNSISLLPCRLAIVYMCNGIPINLPDELYLQGALCILTREKTASFTAATTMTKTTL